MEWRGRRLTASPAALCPSARLLAEWAHVQAKYWPQALTSPLVDLDASPFVEALMHIATCVASMEASSTIVAAIQPREMHMLKPIWKARMS